MFIADFVIQLNTGFIDDNGMVSCLPVCCFYCIHRDGAAPLLSSSSSVDIVVQVFSDSVFSTVPSSPLLLYNVPLRTRGDARVITLSYYGLMEGA